MTKLHLSSNSQIHNWLYAAAAAKKKCFAAKSFCTWSSTFSQSLMVSVSKSKSVYASLIIVLAKSTWQQLIRAVSCHTQNLLRVLHLSAGQCPGAHNAWDNHFFAVTSPNVDWLWSPYVIGQTIIFSCCGLFFLLLLLLFFPRLISAATDWMSAILPHMVWPLCEFKMQVWNLLHAASWKRRTQKSRHKSSSGHHRTTLSGFIFATKQQYVLHMSP